MLAVQAWVLAVSVSSTAGGADRSLAMASRVPEFDAAVESFGAYSRRLEQHFVASGVGEEEVEKRRAILLSAVGASTFSLLKDLIAPATVGEKTFKDLVKALVDHFEPQQSAIVSRFRFHSCNRDVSESVSSFLARLRKFAKPCKFQPGQLDEMLRDRLVCGIQHERLQSRLLSEPTLTLLTAVEIAQTHESAAASAAELSGLAEPADIRRVESAPRAVRSDRQALVNDRQVLVNDRQALVNDRRQTVVRSRAASRDPPLREACSRCLSRWHGPAACPFRLRSCFACGAIGHTRAACRTRAGPQRVRLVEEEPSGEQQQQQQQLEPPGLTGAQTGGTSTYHDGENDPYYLFSTQSVPAAGERKPPLIVNVCLDGQPLRMELDTGAALSVCSEQAFKSVWPVDGPVIKPCAKVLKTYSGEVLELCGQAMVDVRYGEQRAQLPLIVVKGERAISFR